MDVWGGEPEKERADLGAIAKLLIILAYGLAMTPVVLRAAGLI